MILNNEMNLTCPDGFHVLTEEERSKMAFIANGPGVVLSDPDRHIIFSVGWETLSGVVGLLISTHSVAEKMKTVIAISNASYSYHEAGGLKRQIGGLKSEGVRYEYKAQDIDMTGETYVVKVKKTLYYLNCYTRTALTQENAPLWTEILDSIKFN